ncbi:sugar ABC transporter ATP-binding protein [Clostridium sp. AN503]|uniref:sugar ABC transporter ATP-binding protein n=1 Tax=Clostridium sp. AN503 TaxID=3160598 RepID=UPI0034578EED
MGQEEYVLELNGIVKKYPGVTALNGVSLKVRPGEIHALIGENGAGKSTLIKTCSGAVVPTEGEIVVNGKRFKAMTPKLAAENGIAIIYQEFNNVGELSVAENIFLGRAIRNGIVIDRKRMEEESRKVFEQLNIRIDPRAMVKDLTVGYQQMVEIAKAIQQNANILIMDEPSAPLTKAEVESMMKIVEKLKADGVSIIYISHRLDEIFRLSDRITVLRDGEYVTTLITKDSCVDELVALMVGRELTETYPKRKNCIQDEIVMEFQDVTGNGDKDISFSVRKGEILGVGGLVGAGRTELAQMMFGAARVKKGKILFKGREIRPKSPREAIGLGITLVPEDRKQQGALLEMDIKTNINMPIFKRISKGTVVNRREEERIAEKYRADLRIKTPTVKQLVKNLSGGNQQKVILGKWMAANSEFIIFDEPTRGIDIGAKYEIYKLMNEMVESGKTIFLISSEMEELMGMSDRIIVLSEGRITGELGKSEFKQETIMAFASKVEGV